MHMLYYYFESAKTYTAKFVRFVVIVIGVLLLAILLKSLVSAFMASPNSQPTMSIYTKVQSVADIEIQNFDDALLKKLETVLVANARIMLVKQNSELNYASITSQSYYLPWGGERLAVVEMNIKYKGLSSNPVTVAGIVNKDLKTVSCFYSDDTPVSLSQGPCAEAVERAFGKK